VSDEAWAAASPDRQAGRRLGLAADDRRLRTRRQRRRRLRPRHSHLTRTALNLDARGWNELSRACLRLLAQVDRIEEAAKERIARNPHAGDTRDIALVVMLFEAARLTAENPDDPATARRRHHRRELEAPVD